MAVNNIIDTPDQGKSVVADVLSVSNESTNKQTNNASNVQTKTIELTPEQTDKYIQQTIDDIKKDPTKPISGHHFSTLYDAYNRAFTAMGLNLNAYDYSLMLQDPVKNIDATQRVVSAISGRDVNEVEAIKGFLSLTPDNKATSDFYKAFQDKVLTDYGIKKGKLESKGIYLDNKGELDAKVKTNKVIQKTIDKNKFKTFKDNIQKHQKILKETKDNLNKYSDQINKLKEETKGIKIRKGSLPTNNKYERAMSIIFDIASQAIDEYDVNNKTKEIDDAYNTLEGAKDEKNATNQKYIKELDKKLNKLKGNVDLNDAIKNKIRGNADYIRQQLLKKNKDDKNGLEEKELNRLIENYDIEVFQNSLNYYKLIDKNKVLQTKPTKEPESSTSIFPQAKAAVASSTYVEPKRLPKPEYTNTDIATLLNAYGPKYFETIAKQGKVNIQSKGKEYDITLHKSTYDVVNQEWKNETLRSDLIRTYLPQFIHNLQNYIDKRDVNQYNQLIDLINSGTGFEGAKNFIKLEDVLKEIKSKKEYVIKDFKEEGIKHTPDVIDNEDISKRLLKGNNNDILVRAFKNFVIGNIVRNEQVEKLAIINNKLQTNWDVTKKAFATFIYSFHNTFIPGTLNDIYSLFQSKDQQFIYDLSKTLEYSKIAYNDLDPNNHTFGEVMIGISQGLGSIVGMVGTGIITGELGAAIGSTRIFNSAVSFLNRSQKIANIIKWLPNTLNTLEKGNKFQKISAWYLKNTLSPMNIFVMSPMEAFQQSISKRGEEDIMKAKLLRMAELPDVYTPQLINAANNKLVSFKDGIISIDDNKLNELYSSARKTDFYYNWVLLTLTNPVDVSYNAASGSMNKLSQMIFRKSLNKVKTPLPLKVIRETGQFKGLKFELDKKALAPWITSRALPKAIQIYIQNVVETGQEVAQDAGQKLIYEALENSMLYGDVYDVGLSELSKTAGLGFARSSVYGFGSYSSDDPEERMTAISTFWASALLAGGGTTLTGVAKYTKAQGLIRQFNETLKKLGLENQGILNITNDGLVFNMEHLKGDTHVPQAVKDIADGKLTNIPFKEDQQINESIQYNSKFIALLHILKELNGLEQFQDNFNKVYIEGLTEAINNANNEDDLAYILAVSTGNISPTSNNMFNANELNNKDKQVISDIKKNLFENIDANPNERIIKIKNWMLNNIKRTESLIKWFNENHDKVDEHIKKELKQKVLIDRWEFSEQEANELIDSIDTEESIINAKDKLVKTISEKLKVLDEVKESIKGINLNTIIRESIDEHVNSILEKDENKKTIQNKIALSLEKDNKAKDTIVNNIANKLKDKNIEENTAKQFAENIYNQIINIAKEAKKNKQDVYQTLTSLNITNILFSFTDKTSSEQYVDNLIKILEPFVSDENKSKLQSIKYLIANNLPYIEKEINTEQLIYNLVNNDSSLLKQLGLEDDAIKDINKLKKILYLKSIYLKSKELYLTTKGKLDLNYDNIEKRLNEIRETIFNEFGVKLDISEIADINGFREYIINIGKILKDRIKNNIKQLESIKLKEGINSKDKKYIEKQLELLKQIEQLFDINKDLTEEENIKYAQLVLSLNDLGINLEAYIPVEQNASLSETEPITFSEFNNLLKKVYLDFSYYLSVSLELNSIKNIINLEDITGVKANTKYKLLISDILNEILNDIERQYGKDINKDNISFVKSSLNVYINSLLEQTVKQYAKKYGINENDPNFTNIIENIKSIISKYVEKEGYFDSNLYYKKDNKLVKAQIITKLRDLFEYISNVLSTDIGGNLLIIDKNTNKPYLSPILYHKYYEDLLKRIINRANKLDVIAEDKHKVLSQLSEMYEALDNVFASRRMLSLLDDFSKIKAYDLLDKLEDNEKNNTIVEAINKEIDTLKWINEVTNKINNTYKIKTQPQEQPVTDTETNKEGVKNELEPITPSAQQEISDAEEENGEGFETTPKPMSKTKKNLHNILNPQTQAKPKDEQTRQDEQKSVISIDNNLTMTQDKNNITITKTNKQSSEIKIKSTNRRIIPQLPNIPKQQTTTKEYSDSLLRKVDPSTYKEVKEDIPQTKATFNETPKPEDNLENNVAVSIIGEIDKLIKDEINYLNLLNYIEDIIMSHKFITESEYKDIELKLKELFDTGRFELLEINEIKLALKNIIKTCK